MHCPVSLAKRGLLIDCTRKLDLAVSTAGGTFFAVAGAAEHEALIESPAVATTAVAEVPAGGKSCYVLVLWAFACRISHTYEDDTV